MVEERTQWVDCGKGIGITLVVYGHLLSSAYNAQIPIAGSFFRLSDSLLYSFHMPLFFFLAGLFALPSLQKRGLKHFVINKLQHIAYPYLVWSVIQGVTEVLFSKQSHRGITSQDILGIPLYPLDHFWFLYALFMMYMVVGLGYCVLAAEKRFEPYMWGGMVSIATILYIWPIPSVFMGLHGFSTGFLYFLAGVLLKKKFPEFNKINIRPLVTTITVVSFFIFGYIVFTRIIGPVRLTSGVYPLYFLVLSILGIVGSLGIAQLAGSRRIGNVLTLLGKYSIQIYLVHMLAGVLTRIVLLKIFFIENPWVHMVLGVLGGVFIPIAVYKTCVRLHLQFFFEPVFRKNLSIKD